MNLIELIGFIFSMLVMVILMINKVRAERRRLANPEEYEREEQEQAEELRRFLLEVEGNDDEESPYVNFSKEVRNESRERSREERRENFYKTAPSNDQMRFSRALEKRKFESSVEKRALQSSLDERYSTKENRGYAPQANDAYAIVQTYRTSRASNTIAQVGSLKKMIILKEIMSPPKSLRE